MKMWEGVFERLDRLSRQRALTDAESCMLERAIAGLEKPSTANNGKPWTTDEENRFCDMVADGWSIAAASRAIERTPNAGSGFMDRLRRYYGWQAA